jgi:DNA-binding NarL/FixJ family response regulator
VERNNGPVKCKPGLSPMKKIRILLIEDNRLLREGITTTINGQPDFKVVGPSVGDHNSLQQVRKRKPDVVLMDMGLRSQNGLRVVASLRNEIPELKVIGMGLIPTQSDIVEFVQAGASGFILKDATVRDFLRTIRLVAHGEKVLPPPLTGSLFSHVVEYALKNGKKQLRRAVRMTRREREIIALIAEGLSNKEIAERLTIATYTVKSHVHNIMEKLALHSRLQITRHTQDEAAT